MSLRRIAYVLKVFPKLSETFIAEELAEIRRRGIEVRVISLEPARAELRHSLISETGLDQVTSYPPCDFLSELKAFRPELLHAHFATEATAATIDWSIELQVPFTFTAHGYDIHRKPPADFGARACAASAVVTVSQANATYITQHFGVPPEHLRVIPCGVNLDRFKPADSRLNGNPPLVVCVARHVAVKNLGLLLSGCALLKDRGVNFRCVLVGDGPLRPELEKMRQEKGLENLVELAGAADQEEVLKWWQKASVGVLTSTNEGMPVSLMEAAACGVPVVATAVGGVRELVQSGETGFLVSEGDAGGLADALAELLKTPELRSRLGVAARQRAQELFSIKRQVDDLLSVWFEVLEKKSKPTVHVWDSFGAANDPEMPLLVQALDPLQVHEQLNKRLPRLTGTDGSARLKTIRVIRHKPRRRCVVEYNVGISKPGRNEEQVVLIGKSRARRFGKSGYRLLDRIWNAGFDSASPDGVSVPEPIGVVSRFQMWFQRKVPGKTATHLLGHSNGVQLARRIAEAIHKLHRADIPSERTHRMDDELRILDECLVKVKELKPGLIPRLESVLRASRELGRSLPAPHACGIHRDFYPSQVIVDQERIYLIDFDLFCLGDPGLDVGNFIGHMIEQSLRENGDPQAWIKQQEALEERFVELSGPATRAAIHTYTTLTLVRHIYLSTQFSNRQPLTELLLSLCEQRLDLACAARS